MQDKELELHNRANSARDYFESVCNTDEMKTFHQAICKNFNMDRVFTIEDVKYLLYEYEDIKKFGVENFQENESVVAAINYVNAEKEYYNYINEIYE